MGIPYCHTEGHTGLSGAYHRCYECSLEIVGYNGYSPIFEDPSVLEYT